MNFHHGQGSALLELTGGIVSAYVSNNSVPAAEMPSLIANVHLALCGLGAVASAESATPVEKPTPAQIRKSITPDALISFIDGRPYKTLKRHLAAHGLDPKGYRGRYELPKDYPMVAANYAAQRSALAKAIGLRRPGGMAEDGEPKERGRKTG
ncbi:MucR family transcriptional regulator [Methylobacterium radiodurans]|uniref:MucR family transcriptional regulator n=1 Tax=Methylobacterium radiodurans TaxID=2202828 RepID=A0A2U8VVP5_9HYPH|nr:MucR family transcriptional regulator [Methylobacterium radiodurans]AWN37196.1 MucR family transcriptional regulator [Methylobacterium radiodurans]